MTRPLLWLLLADASTPDLPLVAATVAWMADSANATFEGYFETARTGLLFASTGSTVLGGAHHAQFNYLHAAYDVRCIVYGPTEVFDSSLSVFQTPVIARADRPTTLYAQLLAVKGVCSPDSALIAPTRGVEASDHMLDLTPYLFPEILHRRALAFADPHEAVTLLRGLQVHDVGYLYLDASGSNEVIQVYPGATLIDDLQDSDTFGSVTLRIARRWIHASQGVTFGDPLVTLARLPAHCRERRVAVFGEKVPLASAEIAVQRYTEEKSEIATQAAALAVEVNNLTLVGRQTGDGDLLEWSKHGVCMQIVDPNRPAFPSVAEIAHPWASSKTGMFDDEPDDEQLLRYAHEGRILASLLFHSGETAHNEAMLNLFEVAGFTGLKFGVGVHAARYETNPQTWELLNVARAKGGMRGLIEPLLHSGGRGVLAEAHCPPDRLREHCATALACIQALAGEANTPRGYYAFLDTTDLETLTSGLPEAYDAIAATGLTYTVSSARPGRNRLIYETDAHVVLNQTARSVAHASPFVRITAVDELKENAPKIRPGWLLATLDAPVISFNPYIWREGTRFMKIVDWLLNEPGVTNVLPATIARYARILRQEGFLPPTVS